MCTNNSESATVELVHWRQQLLVVGELGLAGWDSHQWDSVPLPLTEIATSGTRSTPSSSRPPPFIPITIFQLVNRIKCEDSNNPIHFFQRLKKTTMTWLRRLELLRWDQICKISRRHYNKDNKETRCLRSTRSWCLCSSWLWLLLLESVSWIQIVSSHSSSAGFKQFR